MATPVIMPRQGQSVESCIIAKWYKKKGDTVSAGDVLFTYETDKAAFDEEAQAGGTLLDIFFQEGDDVPVLTTVCVIGNKDESADAFNPNAQASSTGNTAATVSQAAVEKSEVKAEVTAAAPAVSSGETVKISPRAKNLAEKAGVDYNMAVPSGPSGRIIERDIISLKENGPVVTASAREEYSRLSSSKPVEGTGLGGRITTSDLGSKASNISETAAPGSLYEEVKLTNIRKVIAKAMHSSLSTTAQLTLNSSVDATDILSFRKKVKEGGGRLGLENITLNDIILFAVSRTLLNHKDLNAHFTEDKLLRFYDVQLGVAVDTDRGLMVPTVFNAGRKSLNEISSEVKTLIQECQKGTINPDLLKGGSFTVTNLGTLGVESFTPVLNPPQTGILGVCSIVQKPREVKGEIIFYPAMGLSLTFDHRALDGAPAARFLQELVNNLENFSILLAI